MKLLNVKTLEECLDQVAIKEYEFDSPATKQFIDYLGRGGKLEYFKFARPFYRLTKSGVYILKGIEEAATLQVVYMRYQPAHQEELLSLIENYSEAGELPKTADGTCAR